MRIDSPVPHLDRPFDYAIPESMDADAKIGTRVRVRFAGRLVNGFIVDRTQTSQIDGQIRPIDRVIAPEVVLTPEILQLVEAVAARYAGTFSDVVRMAVPARHARAEAHPTTSVGANFVCEADVADSWSDYVHGPAMLSRLCAGTARELRGVWAAAPARSWTGEVASAVRAVLTRATGGVIVVVPDGWDVEQLLGALDDCRPTIAVLSADLGPERRYREFCRVLRGAARVVIGTRSAVFAPVAQLELVVVWDDANDLMWEPHAPYWNVRDVAALRSHQHGCALLVGSPSRSVEAQQWCESGFAQSIHPTRHTVKERAPIVRGFEPGDQARDEASTAARIPRIAWLVAKEAVRTGPVLIQVARRGYVPGLSCATCRTPARCSCGGPLGLAPSTRQAHCEWCGRPAVDWSCATCHDNRFRASAVGVERTAEEFGRAFPGERIIWSSGDQLVRRVPAESAIVIATPGAEPVADGGYVAVVILDARGQLQRPSMRAVEDAAQRWFGALMLARSKAHAVITAENASSAVQALARWDAVWLAERELADRESAGLPPASRVVVLRGAAADIAAVNESVQGPHRLLGPVDDRALMLMQRDAAATIARELRAITATRSAKAAFGQVTVMVDPRSVDG